VSPERIETEVDGRRLSLSNLDKVLYPATGFTKGQVLDYYARIAEVMVPHLRGRPATFKRYPSGVEGTSFYEKHVPSNAPEWIATITVPSKSDPLETIEYTEVDSRATLLWAANLASLEFHVPLWHITKGKPLPTPPDYMVFDLDPGPNTSIAECCEVAGWIVDLLGEENVLAKTSGSKGLQLYLPVKRMTWDRAHERSHEIAQTIENDHPERVVSIMRKSLRSGKVLIDWSQNSPSKTTVAAYSLRARPEPTVSTPVTWDEVKRCAKSGDANDLHFEADDVLKRIESIGDLMAPLITKRSSSAKTLKK
jgi:bifunctional non-homologous end joining protein LigD